MAAATAAAAAAPWLRRGYAGPGGTATSRAAVAAAVGVSSEALREALRVIWPGIGLGRLLSQGMTCSPVVGASIWQWKSATGSAMPCAGGAGRGVAAFQGLQSKQSANNVPTVG